MIRYTPPDTGGTVDMTVSAELARLLWGFLGTISLADLRPLPEADRVRDELSNLHDGLDRVLTHTQWKDKGHELRFGKEEL